MADPKRTLAQSYLCPKCRGRTPHAREVTIPKSGLLDFLPSRDNRYIEVTCSLCGYTEFYNRALYVKGCAAAAEEANDEEVPLPKRAGGGRG